jgi:hypothetical protein
LLRETSGNVWFAAWPNFRYWRIVLKKSGDTPTRAKWVLSAKSRLNQINGLSFPGWANLA